MAPTTRSMSKTVKNAVSSQEKENIQLKMQLRKCMEELKAEKQKNKDQSQLLETLKSQNQAFLRAQQEVLRLNAKKTELMKMYHLKSNEIIQKATAANKLLVKKQKDLLDIRGKNIELMNKQLKGEMGKNGEPFPWQICEICVIPYSGEEENTPRILNCGHTVCLACARKLIYQNAIRCPFDTIGSVVHEPIEKNLRKNRLILDLCT